MKLFFLCLSLLQCILATAQSDSQYHAYTSKIKQFSIPSRILYKHIDATGNGSIEFTNAKKQILRFRILNQKLQIQHGGVAYQLFYYTNNYLQRIESFDADGNLAGERESKNATYTNNYNECVQWTTSIIPLFCKPVLIIW